MCFFQIAHKKAHESRAMNRHWRHSTLALAVVGNIVKGGNVTKRGVHLLTPQEGTVLHPVNLAGAGDKERP
jgi:hypothetical protein